MGQSARTDKYSYRIKLEIVILDVSTDAQIVDGRVDIIESYTPIGTVSSMLADNLHDALEKLRETMER